MLLSCLHFLIKCGRLGRSNVETVNSQTRRLKSAESLWSGRSIQETEESNQNETMLIIAWQDLVTLPRLSFTRTFPRLRTNGHSALQVLIFSFKSRFVPYRTAAYMLQQTGDQFTDVADLRHLALVSLFADPFRYTPFS